MDDGGPTASILLFLGLLLLEAYCYGFGAAIHGLNEKEVERKAIEENDKRSLLLSRLVGKPSRYVNTVQLVVTFLNLCMGGMYLRVWSSHIRKMLRALAERQAGCLLYGRADYSGLPGDYRDPSALHTAGFRHADTEEAGFPVTGEMGLQND